MREQRSVEVAYKQPSSVPPGFAAEVESDRQIAEDAAAEAAIKKIEGSILDFLKSRPKYAARLVQFLMGITRIATLESKKG